MSDFQELHQEIIRDHFKTPSYRGVLNPDAPLFENPSCGDQVKLQFSFDNDKITQARFDGAGCSISMASTDMMCELLEGSSKSEAVKRVNLFLGIMRGERPVLDLEELGDAVSLSGVVQLPVRVKCATLAWNAALKLLS